MIHSHAVRRRTFLLCATLSLTSLVGCKDASRPAAPPAPAPVGAARGGTASQPATATNPASDPRLSAELVAFSRALAPLSDPQSVHRAVREFAVKHQPAMGTTVVLVSDDQTTRVAIGADGTADSINGTDAALDPAAPTLNVVIAGDGYSPKTGNGGDGGAAVLKSKPTAGRVILAVGSGGRGGNADATHPAGNGGSGGGGSAESLRSGDLAVGGNGGNGGGG